MTENELVEEVQEEATASEEVVEEVEQEEIVADDEQSEEVEENKPPKGKDAEGRIKELNWKKKQAEEEASKWRELFLETQRSKQQAEPEPEQPQGPEYPDAPVPPDRFDYDTDEEYKKAVASYQKSNIEWVKEVNRRDKEFADRQQQQVQRQQFISERQMTLAQKLNQGREKYHDFESVYSNPQVNYTETMLQSLVDADNTSEIAYHFGNNPDEANKIASMQPIQQIMAIAKLDAQLAGNNKKTTKAPPPSEPVKAATSGAIINPDDLSVDEWLKLRKEGKIK